MKPELPEETKYRSKTVDEIDEINIHKIKEQALNMLEDYDILSENELQNKYNYLYITTKNLFDMIIRDKNDEKDKKIRNNKIYIFNKDDFKTNLDFILNQISNIKTTKVFNDNIVKTVGDNFSTKYIPAKFLKK